MRQSQRAFRCPRRNWLPTTGYWLLPLTFSHPEDSRAAGMNRGAMTDSFLHDASPQQLEAAVAANHHEWMVRKAEAAGGEVHQAEGMTWTYAGPKGEAMVLFPRL